MSCGWVPMLLCLWVEELEFLEMCTRKYCFLVFSPIGFRNVKVIFRLVICWENGKILSVLYIFFKILFILVCIRVYIVPCVHVKIRGHPYAVGSLPLLFT